MTANNLRTPVPDQKSNLRAESERDFVSALLDGAIHGKAALVAEVAAWFQPRWMLDPWYADLTNSIFTLASSGTPFTPRNIAYALKGKCRFHNQSLLAIGDLILNAYGSAHLRFFGRQVYDEYRRVAAAGDSAAASHDLFDGDDIDETLDHLGGLPEKYAPLTRRVQANEEAIQEILDDLEGKGDPRVLTGLPALDAMVGGFGAGHLGIVGASTSNGKSTFLSHVAIHTARHTRKRVCFFSVEMTEKELYRRWGCWLSQTWPKDSENRRRFLGGLAEVQQLVTQHSLLQVFSGGRTVKQIEKEARAYRDNMGLVCVDYIQLLRPIDPRETRERQVAEITARLKMLAQECRVPILAAAQLNRAAGEAPRMHHLRESGAIEQDADVVMILDPQKTASEWTAVSIGVPKNRHGATGKVQVLWNKSIYRYRDSDVYDAPNYEPAFEQNGRHE